MIGRQREESLGTAGVSPTWFIRPFSPVHQKDTGSGGSRRAIPRSFLTGEFGFVKADGRTQRTDTTPLLWKHVPAERTRWPKPLGAANVLRSAPGQESVGNSGFSYRPDCPKILWTGPQRESHRRRLGAYGGLRRLCAGHWRCPEALREYQFGFFPRWSFPCSP